MSPEAMTTDELNAALAAKSAPILGEMAVYRLTSCPQGHVRTGRAPGDWCHDCVHSAAEQQYQDWEDQDDWCNQMRLLMESDATLYPEWRYQHVPVDFTDPAVLWSLWERWDVEHDWTVTVYRRPIGGFVKTILQCFGVPYGQGASSTEAVARAWCTVLPEAGVQQRAVYRLPGYVRTVDHPRPWLEKEDPDA